MTTTPAPTDIDAIRARHEVALRWLREGYSYDDNFNQAALLIRDDVPALLDELAKTRAELDHLRRVLDAANETTAAAQQIVTAALADGTARVNPATTAEPADEPFDCAPECRCQTTKAAPAAG